MGHGARAVVAHVACARIGATHNVIFGGFRQALRDRVNDSKAAKIVIKDELLIALGRFYTAQARRRCAFDPNADRRKCGRLPPRTERGNSNGYRAA